MIIVTGTKRSGTSLWMQILERTGYPILGEKFPSEWGASIRDANPNGFYESTLRYGINWTSNPSKDYYFAPEPYRNHAVKVFMAGLVRTDAAHIHKVVVTVRHWAEYGKSLRRLFDIEDAYTASLQDEAERTKREKAAKEGRGNMNEEDEWFLENYDFLRDYNLRRYECQLTAYDDLVGDPEKTLGRVLPWLGFGKVEVAAGAIDDALRNRKITRPEVKHENAEIYEDFYQALSKASVPATLVTKLNETAIAVRAKYKDLGVSNGGSSGD
jgi:hypothetical protein